MQMVIIGYFPPISSSSHQFKVLGPITLVSTSPAFDGFFFYLLLFFLLF